MKKYLLLLALAILAPMGAQAADCFVSEYAYITRSADSKDVQVARAAVTTQQVTYTTSTQSAAFNTATKYIRVICTAKAHFVISTNPTATAATPYLPTDLPEYFGVEAGQKIAFYDGAS